MARASAIMRALLALVAAMLIASAPLANAQLVSASSSRTATQTPSGTASQTLTPTPTASQTLTPTSTASPTQTPTATPSQTITPTQSPSQTSTASSSPSQTATPTPSPSQTGTPTPSQTPSQTNTHTPTPTPSQTITPTPSPSPSASQTLTPTSTASQTPSPSPTASQTPSPTSTASQTPSPTATASQSVAPVSGLAAEDSSSSGDFAIDSSDEDEPLSGVSTAEASQEDTFTTNDQVVITMHVDIPDIEPVLTKLKAVQVEITGSGSVHSLFDDYAVTAKGVSNNLDHTAADNQKDSTTFRLTQLVMNEPAEDPVFVSTASVDPYSITSTATVEYQTSTGRRLGEVSTFRAGPAKRGLKTSQVDVVATNEIKVAGDMSAMATGASASGASSGSNTTIIIIGVGAFVGVAFVLAGAVFFVKSRCMQSRVQRSKDKARFYSAKNTSGNAGINTGVVAGSEPAATPARPVASLRELSAALQQQRPLSEVVTSPSPSAAGSPDSASDSGSRPLPPSPASAVSRSKKPLRKVHRLKKKLRSAGDSADSDTSVQSAGSVSSRKSATSKSGKRVRRVVRKMKPHSTSA